MAYYLDVSALVPVLLNDAHGPAMHAWLRQEPRTVVVSDFAAAEFAGVVSRSVRMYRLSTTAAATILAQFDNWQQRNASARLTDSNAVASCGRLVRDFSLKLSVPDALHLAMAMTDGTTLVTFDERLADAAKTLGHPVIVPKA